MILDQLKIPVVLAPLAGGPSTPELAAAVTEAGGLGFIASGYLDPGQMRERIQAARRLSSGPLGVNVFAPPAGPAGESVYRSYTEELAGWAEPRGIELGQPRWSDDGWEAKLDLLAAEPVEVVSFTFGCPSAEVVQRLQSAGSEVWVTVTLPEEAMTAVEAGADALVLQGAEAGGHRASFTDHAGLVSLGLLALIGLVREQVDLPLVASGGIATGESLAAVLAAGAAAGQVGTAFMLAPEAGTTPAHRQALLSDRPTVLTRAFTGRLARGIANEFTAAHSARAPIAYPELHYVTAPMRRRARQQDDAELINLWAGEAHALAQALPAAEIARSLADGARKALREALHRQTDA